jgi:hypothetical protein
LFIAALGELVSAEAEEDASADDPEAVALLDMPAPEPASVALDEVPPAALSCWLCVSLAVGLVVSPAPVCVLEVVGEAACVVSGWLAVDCALTAPGTMIAAAARRSTLRMNSLHLLVWDDVIKTLARPGLFPGCDELPQMADV